MGKRSDESLAELPEEALPKKMMRLSVISEVDVDTMSLAATLVEAHTLKEAEDRLKQCKTRIRELAHEKGYLTGVRCAGLCAIVRWQDGRLTLNKELLIENGVTPSQIEQSTTRGAGNWVLELPRIVGPNQVMDEF